MNSQVWTRGPNRRKRILYVSSPIGLGHARRDLAIANELRRLQPDVQIDWLAQDPVTAVLQSEGEHIHPASAWLASESGHFASEACGHDLHCFQALRSMDEILVANFMIFQEVVEEGLYDLVIGDEAWDVDHYWHENPELKRGAHVWLTDFVGYLPMPDGGDHEALLTADYNAEMIEHIDKFPRIRDRSIYVGNVDDVVPESFGDGLPEHPRVDRIALRLLRLHHRIRAADTGPDRAMAGRVRLRRRRTDLRRSPSAARASVATCSRWRSPPTCSRDGPSRGCARSSSPAHASTPTPSHDTPASRCTATSIGCIATSRSATSPSCRAGSRRRWSSPPPSGPSSTSRSSHHFEQNFHVRHRLDQYGAGTCMDFATTDPDALAEAIVVDDRSTGSLSRRRDRRCPPRRGDDRRTRLTVRDQVVHRCQAPMHDLARRLAQLSARRSARRSTLRTLPDAVRGKSVTTRSSSGHF